MKRLLCGVAAILLSVPAIAMAQDAPADTYVFAGTLLDKPGEEPRGESTIIIRDGLVAEILDGFAEPVAGSTVIDLRDQFVMPGMIDVHVHLGDNPYEALHNATITLEAGFTTLRNLGDASGTARELSKAIRDGVIRGPRIVDVGAAITSVYGHGDPRIATFGGLEEHAEHNHALNLSGVCTGDEDCRRAVRMQVAQGAEAIKIVPGGLSARPIGAEVGAQMTLAEIRAVVETAHGFGVPVSAHTHGGQSMRFAAEAGVDSIEHGQHMYRIDGDIEVLAASGTYYVPTLSTMNSHVRAIESGDQALIDRMGSVGRLERGGLSTKAAHEAGVRFAVGTDAGISAHGENATEFWHLVNNGLTPMEAIVAGTVNAADLLNLSDKVGTLEVGKVADLVGLAESPLENIRILQDVSFVMHAGDIIVGAAE